MTHSLTVYGFGSAFGDCAEVNDIDLMIVHSNSSPASCQLAIQCRRRILESVARAHVTMLSESEAEHFEVIKTSQAIKLGSMRNVNFDRDFSVLLSNILNCVPRGNINKFMQ